MADVKLVADMKAIPKSASDLLAKKYKIENKTLLYGTVTHITALFST